MVHIAESPETLAPRAGDNAESVAEFERRSNFGALGYAAAANEHLLTGGRALRAAFYKMPCRYAPRRTKLIEANQPAAPALLIYSGTAYRASRLPDGHQVILDLLLPGDIYGVEQLVMAQSGHDLVVAREVGYRELPIATIRELMADPAIATRLLALMAETQRRMDRHAVLVCALGARERVAVLLLDIYDRLRQRQHVASQSFNLWLTQEQIGDHLGLTMVHVCRTLRQLREEGLIMFHRHVVVLRDLDRLRALVAGLLPPARLD
jgi:CRP-like cAMP-binding protein